MSIPSDSRPRLKPAFDIVPLTGRVRLGSGPSRAVEIDDPDGRYEALLRLLDGDHEVREVVELAAARMRAGEVEETLDELLSMGYLQLDDDTGVLSEDERSRYVANLNCLTLLAPPTETRSAERLQRKLLDTTVLQLGLGGIGSTVAQALAELGVGRIHALDFDRVELGNLNRQVLYSTPAVGTPKIDAAAERLREYNPDLAFTGERRRIESAADVERAIVAARPDFVFGLADRPNAFIDSWVNEACVRQGVPFAAGGVAGEIGNAYSVVPGVTACYECRLLKDFEDPAMREEMDYLREHRLDVRTAALGSECFVLAGYLVHEMLRHVLGWGAMLTADRWLEIDLMRFTLDYEDTPRRPDCPVCGDRTAAPA
jgi:molybdopterin/thiamine biosynthesis adenylyltransferase